MFETLSFLINPIEPKSFIADYWEKNCLYIKRNNPSYFSDHFSLEKFDNILMRNNIMYPTVQMFIRGTQVEKDRYCRNWKYGRNTYSDLIDTDAVLEFFRQGATINLQGLERFSPSINLLNQGLELDSGFPVHTTSFLTPKNAENIPPHYDMVDFFTLQISGSKYWRVWQTDVGLPHAVSNQQVERTYENGHPALAAKRLLGEFLLKPGDTLFVPRGFIHEAITTDDHSLHVTIGINPHRRFDLLETIVFETIRVLSNEEAFRRSPPILQYNTVDCASETNLSMLQQLKQDFVQYSKSDDALYKAYQSLDNKLISSRYAGRSKQLSLLTKSPTLSTDSCLVRRKTIVHRIFQQGDRLLLSYLGKHLSFPLYLQEAVSFVCTDSPFLVGEIPGNLDADSKIAFASRLVEEGFLLPSK